MTTMAVNMSISTLPLTTRRAKCTVKAHLENRVELACSGDSWQHSPSRIVEKVPIYGSKRRGTVCLVMR
jgi:hypothetical protein